VLKYRIYIALLIGVCFTATVFCVSASLGANLAVGMMGIAVLMPGIGLAGLLTRLFGIVRCCKSPLPMLAANALIYSGVAFLMTWGLTSGVEKKNLRHFAHSFTLAVAGAMILTWGAAWALGRAWAAPSDEAMARQFKKHRGDLETLVSMTREDSNVSRVADTFIWRKDSAAWPRPESEWGITEERWNEYRGLFRKVGLVAGLNKDSQGNIYFISHTEGSVVSGASKGFVYCEKTGVPESAYLPCSGSQDSGKYENAKNKGSEYHRLTEHWYIYSDWN